MSFGPDNVTPAEKAGIERAANWHAETAAMWRHAIADRIKWDIGYGEQLMQAEFHEDCAKRLLDAITAEPKPDLEWFKAKFPEQYAWMK